MTKIANKSVLITGGAQGLGKLIAERCVAQGADRIVLWDVNEAKLQATATSLRGEKTAIQISVVDVADHKAIVRAASEAGPVDILVNNAGVVVGKPLAEHDHADIEKTIGVNVLGVMHTTRAFLPGMLAQGGHIVTIASASGYLALPRLTTYAASKWACLGFSESLRVELRDHTNIQITTVCPSYINTGMFEGVTAPMLVPILDPDYVADRIVDAILRNKPLLRMPWLVNVIPICQAVLPRRLFELICGKWMGIYRAMNMFRGHGGA